MDIKNTQNPKIIGLDKEQVKNLLSQINIIDGFPNFDVFKNVIYLPQFNGLYDQEGKRIDISGLFRKDTFKDVYQYHIPANIEHTNISRIVKDRCIYLGNLFLEQYGHFLTESVSRMWYLKNDLEANIIISNPQRKKNLFFKRKNFIDIFLESLNFHKKDFKSFDEPCLIEEVIIPHPSCILFDKFYNNHKLIHEQVSQVILSKQNIKPTQQPLYLSRSKLNTKYRAIIGEKELEEKLKEKGVSIVYPEKLSFKKQVELINKHETIIGTIGSSLHGVLFDISEKRNLFCLSDEYLLNSTFLMIDTIKLVNSTYIISLNTGKDKTIKDSRTLDIDMTLKTFKDINLFD